jgi:hypothetical protein
MKKDDEEKTKKTFVRWFAENLFAIVAVGVTLANVWFAYKLAPLAQNLAVITERVNAIETKGVINREEFNQLISRLDRIDLKLTNLINLHLEK